MGLIVRDPHGIESSRDTIPGLALLLHMETEMYPENITSQAEAHIISGIAAFPWAQGGAFGV